ncbi:MAG: aldose epimerase family protein [Candidatus Limimorpha sp.]
MTITSKTWGKTIDGKSIMLYTLTNASGYSVQLHDIGAGIVSIVVPDRNGHLDDVVLGYPQATDYFGDGPCMGKVPGRFANRIANGRFTYDQTEYQLDLEPGKNYHLHGGPIGFSNQKWASRIEGNGVVFSYLSADGEAGYPGEVLAKVRYTWNDENELILDFSATTTAPTVINLTNHSYFNLKGEGNGNILDHNLMLNATHYLQTDNSLIPTGKLAEVVNTPMDFTTEKQIGEDIRQDFDAIRNGKGYDSCWVINSYGKDKTNLAATLSHEGSGRRLQIYTTQPAIQVYTGNWLEGCPEGKNGHVYHDYDGVALECQAFPNAPNNPSFPNTFLLPGRDYKETIIFKFSTL